jgi:hypothetical protein
MNAHEGDPPVTTVSGLGPCGQGGCTADAVAYLVRTLGKSARLTVITGPRAVELADHHTTADVTRTVCHEHAAAVLDDLLMTP